MAELVQLVDRLSELSRKKKEITEEYNQVEAEILKVGETKLEDSKEKSISYVGSGSNKVTFTKSESLKLVFPSRLKDIFGTVYNDVVEEKTTYTVNAHGKRILTNMWLNNYLKDSSIESIVKSLNVDEKTEKVLMKKLKGKNAETDKKTLISVAGLNEKIAEETAYFVSEVVAWENFMMIIKANDKTIEDIPSVLKDIDSAVVVDEGVKLTVE